MGIPAFSSESLLILFLRSNDVLRLMANVHGINNIKCFFFLNYSLNIERSAVEPRYKISKQTFTLIQLCRNEKNNNINNNLPTITT